MSVAGPTARAWVAAASVLLCLPLPVTALGTPDPGWWVERRGPLLMISGPLDRWVDEGLRRRLQSGLRTTLRLHVQLVRHPSGEVQGGLWRHASAKYDLWEEVLEVEMAGDAGEGTRRYASLTAFLLDFARLEARPLATGVPEDPALWRVRARLEVNPISAEQVLRMRRWLAARERELGPDPVGGALAAVVRLFDGAGPGEAERVVEAEGHPFRGDRLPHRR